MKLHYHPETDSLYIEFSDRAGANTVEIARDVVVDLAEDGSIVGIDIDHASKKLDLQRLETVSLPFVQATLA